MDNIYGEENCTLCDNFGYRQIYEAGRVERIMCDCPAGQRNKEKLKNLKYQGSAVAESKKPKTHNRLIELARAKIEKMNHGCVYTTDYELKALFEEIIDQFDLTSNALQKCETLRHFQTLYLKKNMKKIEFLKFKLKDTQK